MAVTLDALPYLDTELSDPAMKRRVDALIAEEMRSMEDYDPLESGLPVGSERPSAWLKAELERMGRGEELDAVDASRYDIEGLSLSEGDEAGWQDALRRAKVAVEVEASRLLNLELMGKYGESAWRVHNVEIEQSQRRLAGERRGVKRRIDEVNRARKKEQLAAAPRLQRGRARYSELVDKTAAVEGACAALEREVKRLRTEARSRGLLPAEAEDDSGDSTAAAASAAAAAVASLD
eukprot:PLAT13463.1.p1 GENE.PLAT13463.1~~PLAT13463.1.p1  ORF type:complete len:236 (+),score=100.23 PLAT13463.1:45-752(+)